MKIALESIGTVHNTRTHTGDEDWGSVVSTLTLEPAFASGLEGLESWSHALVVFYMHHDPGDEAPPTDWRRRPRGRADMPLAGVFAQRGRMRPNVIGVTAVKIERVEPGRLVVRGLDAIDGTPVLDLKPYAPVFDRVADARVPDWFDTLMRGYY
ncbi:MAG: SAM-dependent methyltransferase [Candidatus Eisenbacteria bacterium]